MSFRQRIAKLFADEPAKPAEGEAVAYASGQQSWGDTEARIGTYNPNSVSYATMAKMLDHYQVAAGCDLIALPLMAAEYSIDGEPEISAYVHAVTDRIWADVLRACAHGVAVGFAPTEVPFERSVTHVTDEANDIDDDIDGWRPSRVKDIDPQNISSILVDGFGNFNGYKAITPAVDVEPERLLHFASGVRYGNWWGKGRLVRAYDPWFRSVVTSDAMTRYVDRLGSPPVKAYHPPGSTDGTPHRDAARSMGTAFTGDETTFTLPLSAKTGTDGGVEYYKTWDIELLRDDPRASMFLQVLEYHNKCILRGLLIPDTMFTQSTTGSLALSQTHLDTFLMGEDGVLSEIVRAYNEQMIPRIVRYTFGANAPIPMMVSQGLTDEAKAFAAQIFTAAVQTGQIAVEWDKIADRLNIPTVADDTGDPLDAAKAELRALAEAARKVRLGLHV